VTGGTAREHLSDESGMTLIELMISMTLLTVVLVPIGAAMLLSLVHSNGIKDRIADSSGAQLVSSYFASDIQSAGNSTSSTNPFVGVDTSGTGSCPALAAGDNLRLRVTTPSPAQPSSVSARTTVIYYSHPTADGHELYRRECTTSTAESPSLIVQNLDGATGFSVTCDPVATCKTVSATLTMYNPASVGSSGYTSSTFDLVGTRRTA
jgi:prepilin-type N-terminal cleavage/methylation domain-containing protein